MTQAAKNIGLLQQVRGVVKELIADLSDEQLLTVPAGFRNNILWNAGHLVVSQQILHYKLADIDMHVTRELVNQFRKGTSPADWDAVPDIAQVKELLVELPKRLEEDYYANKFVRYETYTTSLGLTLQGIADAIAYNNYHEGLHVGTITCLKKLVIDAR
jgi:hypothetical protein